MIKKVRQTEEWIIFSNMCGIRPAGRCRFSPSPAESWTLEL